VPPDTGIETQARIIEAALKAVKTRGSAGASARTIAQIGGFNQASIYYHFGSLKALLLAALDHSSNARMERYISALAAADTPEKVVEVGRHLFDEDVAQGHITVLSELVAACMAHPDLGPEVVRRLEPWVDLTQGLIDRFIKGSFLESYIDTRDAAQALIAFYMGIEMLYHLDHDAGRANRLFDMFSTFVPLVAPMLEPTSTQDTDSHD
jgi:AcrR family transcriptional regulator